MALTLDLAVVLTALASAALALVAYRESMRARKELRAVTSSVTSSLRRLLIVSRALSLALKYAKLEKLAEKVKRRRRRRYVAFYVIVEGGDRVDPTSIEKEIIEAVKTLGGVRALAEARPRLVYYDVTLGAGVLGFDYRSKYLVLAALGLVRQVGGRRALIIPVRTSGTVRKAKRALGLRDW